MLFALSARKGKEQKLIMVVEKNLSGQTLWSLIPQAK